MYETAIYLNNMFIKSIINNLKNSGKITVIIANERGNGEEIFNLTAGEFKRLGLCQLEKNPPQPILPDSEFSLSEVIEVTELLYDDLKSADERSRALSESVRILTNSTKSSTELRRKLKMNNYSSDAIDNAVRILSKKGYINDRKTSITLAESLLRRKKCGRKYVVSYLISHGYSQSDANFAAESIPNENFTSSLRQIIQKKHHNFVNYDRKAREKAYASLIRLGFSLSEIIKIEQELQ